MPTSDLSSAKARTLLECVACQYTEVAGLTIAGIPAWDDELAPLILRPGERLRVVVDRPGYERKKTAAEAADADLDRLGRLAYEAALRRFSTAPLAPSRAWANQGERLKNDWRAVAAAVLAGIKKTNNPK